MKKLIAISVVFALVLGAAFAQPRIGGGLEIGVPLLGGVTQNEVDQKDIYAGSASYAAAHIDIGFGDDSAGGKFRIWHNNNPANGNYSGTLGWKPAFAFVWWKPIDMLRVQLGQNPDGDWGHADISGWGYEAAVKGIGPAMNPSDAGLANLDNPKGAFAPGFNTMGLTLSLNPIDALQINLGIPYNYKAPWQQIYGNMYLDAKFNIDGIGKIMLAFQMHPSKHLRSVPSAAEAYGSEAPEYHWRNSREEAHNPMQAWLGFSLSALENIGAEIGVGFTFPYTTQDADFRTDWSTVGSILLNEKVNVGGVGYGDLPINTKVIAPVKVGLGAKIGLGDDFNIKARAGLSFLGKQKHDRGVSDTLYQAYWDREHARIAGLPISTNSLTHITDDSTKLYLDSDTFYVKETIKVYGGEYAPGYVVPAGANSQLVDVVRWTPKTGTQEVKKDPFEWGLGVKPDYKIGDVTVHLNLGIGMRHYLKQEVRVQKTEKYTDAVTGQSKYVDVFEKDVSVTAERTYANDGNYDGRSKPVYETITFEGKPGLYTKETNITYAQTPTEKNAQQNLIEDSVKFDVNWFINPYVEIPCGNGGNFYVGFKLYTDGERKPLKYDYNAINAMYGVAGTTVAGIQSTKYKVKWAIPIGFTFGF